MRLRFKATHVVLAMLCIMYFITYVDRVNIGTAASEIQKELGLSNTQLGLVFSAFAYPYLLFPVIGGCGRWVGWWFSGKRPRDIRGIPEPDLASLPPRPANMRPEIPWGPLLRRMWPVTLTYFCYGWCLWLYLNWLPLFFKNNYHLDISKSALFASGVFFAGVVGDSLGGILSDGIFRRTGNVLFARLSVIILGFAGAFLSLLPIPFIPDITIVALCLSSGFFFAELVIGPIWSVPMDIASKYSGTAAGLMNSGSAVAASVSPLVARYLIDVTGNWYLPFLMSMGLLLLGGFCAFLMHPEQPFDDLSTPQV